MKPAFVLAAVLVPLLIGAAVLSVWVWGRIGDTPIGPQGYVALGLGVVATLGIGGGPVGAAAFALLHGAGNGLLTIARGTLPLAIFGPGSYGLRTGVLGAPARGAQAFAPVLFGLVLENAGAHWALVLSSSLMLSAFVALLALRPARAAPAVRSS